VYVKRQAVPQLVQRCSLYGNARHYSTLQLSHSRPGWVKFTVGCIDYGRRMPATTPTNQQVVFLHRLVS